jgi:hypothetical protein
MQTETQRLPADKSGHATPALARMTTRLPTWRRCPATVTYLLVLVTTYWITMCLLPRDQALHLLLTVSTNPHNLTQHPLQALLGSALFPATPLLSTPGILTLGVGIGCCMGLIERTRGTWRALATFAAGHTLITLLTVPVVLYGISAHRYDPAARDGLDFGVSYGAIATMAAITSHLPRPLRPLWLAGWATCCPRPPGTGPSRTSPPSATCSPSASALPRLGCSGSSRRRLRPDRR